MKPSHSLRCRLGLGWHWIGLVCAIVALCGCSTPTAFKPSVSRPFDFQKDTFAYANELVWEYHFDPVTGQETHSRREPRPTYYHRCFTVARLARQFFEQVRFDPAQPVANQETYRQLIRQLNRLNPRKELNADQKIVIPGYAGLREFSRAQEALLKAEGGGAWESYWQRGNWRLILPFSRAHQQRIANRLLESTKAQRLVVVHLSTFPSLRMNHAVVVFAAQEDEKYLCFSIYDPNQPQAPTWLNFEQATRTFYFPANLYFAGGRVNVYDVYRGGCY